MEDEECLPENSSLKIYLQNLGFSDVQVTKSCAQISNGINFDLPKPKSSWLNIESIDEGVLEQIGILVSTQMLFEEDISNIQKLLSNFKVAKNGMIKSMFQGAFGVAVVFLGLCLYCVIGCYTFLIVSSFYAYKATDYLWRKHFNQFRLKKLASVLQANFLLLKKTVKFIEENNKFLESNYSDVKDLPNELKESFDFYNNFKSDFLISMIEMIDILSTSTKKLIKNMPFYGYLENPQYYLCNNFSISCYGSLELNKLYQIYLLIQSEFLQRLILSLIPNVKLSKHNNFQDINKILTETCVKLLKIKNNLNKKFKFIFMNGIHCPKSKMKFKLPANSKSCTTNYLQEIISNIHDTSNTFQNLLIKSRILEENVTEKIPENLESELVHIQNDLNICQKNIADSFILLRKANALTDKNNKMKVKKLEPKKCDYEVDKILVGYTDLDPKIEDEIFEAYFTDEKFTTNFSDGDDWDFEDKLKKKIEKEYSKSVIKELKGKLVEKAKNWQKREAELLKKKGELNGNEVTILDNDNRQESLANVVTECTSENYDKNLKCKNLPDMKFDTEIKDALLESSEAIISENSMSDFTNNGKSRGFIGGNIKDESSNSKLIEGDTNNHFHESQRNHLGVLNVKFLNDLHQARQRIFATAKGNEDEFYSDSWENTEEEEE